MHILMYRWKAYNYRDIEQTFLLLGHTVDNIEQELGSYDVSPEFEKVIEQKIRENHYDMVFTVNYFPLISNVCQRAGVKYVSWTCDNPLISMYHTSVFHDCNYIFTFDKTNYLEFRGMGVAHIWYLPLAVDVDRLDDIIERSQDTAKYRGDVAFVGSLYERNSYDKLKNRLPEYLRGYFDAVMEAQLNISGANIVEPMLTADILSRLEEYFTLEKSPDSFSDLGLIFQTTVLGFNISGANIVEPMLTADILSRLEEYFTLEKSPDSFSDLGLIFQTTVLGFKIAEIERRRALIELSKYYHVNVYSNSDVSDMVRIRYCGSVDYWSEMPKVFRASKINLNFTIPNIKSGIPLRVWDVLGSGGFLLTNYQAELPYFFEEGKDLVCFDGVEDLREKVGYYLEHEEERRAIAESGYRKVKETHLYIERIRTMLAQVAEAERGGR